MRDCRGGRVAEWATGINHTPLASRWESAYVDAHGPPRGQSHPRHARSADPQSAELGTAPRIRRGRMDRDDHAGCDVDRRGHALPGAASPRTRGVRRVRKGPVGEQPPGQVLSSERGRPPAAARWDHGVACVRRCRESRFAFNDTGECVMLPAGWRRAFRIDRGKRHIARDVERELAFHLELRTNALIAAGLDPDTARMQALAQFGDLCAVRDECFTIDTHQERAMKWSEIVGNMRRDVRFSIRSLRKQPTFTLAVVLTLALGIGANTAIFSLIDALLLRTLPAQHPEQLVIIGDPSAVNSGWNGSPETRYVSYPLYADVRDHNTVLSGLAASGSASALDVVVAREGAAVDLLTADHPSGRFVTGNYFSVLGVPAF